MSAFRDGERIDAAEFRRRIEEGGRDKFNRAKPARRTWRGKVYDSVAEMKYAQRLDAELQAGRLALVLEQPRLWLGVRENVYVPDFLIIDAAGFRFIDVKGADTPKWRRDRKLWLSYGPAALDVIDAANLTLRERLIGGARTSTPTHKETAP